MSMEYQGLALRLFHYCNNIYVDASKKKKNIYVEVFRLKRKCFASCLTAAADGDRYDIIKGFGRKGLKKRNTCSFLNLDAL